jgi:hypothetical protein
VSERLDVGALRQAIYTVSVRHDWANTTDTEDRTEEIAAEYAGLVESRGSLLSDPWTFVVVGVLLILVLAALMAFGMLPWLR